MARPPSDDRPVESTNGAIEGQQRVSRVKDDQTLAEAEPTLSNLPLQVGNDLVDSTHRSSRTGYVQSLAC